jgi:hypothetical protein
MTRTEIHRELLNMGEEINWILKTWEGQASYNEVYDFAQRVYNLTRDVEEE